MSFRDNLYYGTEMGEYQCNGIEKIGRLRRAWHEQKFNDRFVINNALLESIVTRINHAYRYIYR